MNVATILFTYNRPVHTQKVLEALSKNDRMPQTLIIFQDGMKPTTDKDNWEKTGAVIKCVDWCKTEVHISSTNKGLAESIVQGINYALETNDAIIVLEDDCVPHPKYISFMYACLDKYENQKKVYSIGGCPEPIDIDRVEGMDAYFCGRFSSLGWGTWKDRWGEYERDYSILKKIKRNPESNKRLKIWGNDLESHLIGNITGQCDSWAVFWALKLIEKDKYFLCPYESLITNIGFDGSGVHSGVEQIDREYRAVGNMEDFKLPDTVEITQTAKTGYMDMLLTATVDDRNKSYRQLLCRWIELKQQNHTIKYEFDGCNVAFWGKGWLFDLLQKEFGESLKVQCIIETYPTSTEYKGIPVYSANKIPKEIDTVIVIPFYDIDIIKRKLSRRRPDLKRIMGVDNIIR